MIKIMAIIFLANIFLGFISAKMTCKEGLVILIDDFSSNDPRYHK